MQRAGLQNHIIVVTRWYGGVPLGGDRFAHIVTCVRAYLADLGNPGGADAP
jgi:putative IMPACT (imprinted ancient) family translation regulator